MFGSVVEVKGPVVDVLFEKGQLPAINEALTIDVDKVALQYLIYNAERNM